jgi:hypothetical protein
VPPPSVDESVAIKHRVDRADGWQLHSERALAQLLADLRRAPAWVLALQADDDRFDGRGEPIRLAIGPSAPVTERLHAAVFVTVEDL